MSPEDPPDASKELAELVAVDAKIKMAAAELKSIVLTSRSQLMDFRRVGTRGGRADPGRGR